MGDNDYLDGDASHCTDSDDNKAQQINCKGDKIENITQLLTHLGMGDIKNKCDECDEESRKICLKKEAITALENRDKIPDEQTLTEVLLSTNKLSTNQLSNNKLSNGKSVTNKLPTNKSANDRKRMAENKLILSSFFASVLLTVMSL